jgi:hypothetical protein
MRDTKIMIGGRPALVEAAHYPMFARKEGLVIRAILLQKIVRKCPTDKASALELRRMMGRIINVNRQLRRAGAFCTFVEN